MVSRSRRDSVGGGGVVAEFFRDLHEPTRFSGGGGSTRIFVGRDTHILLRYNKNSHFLRRNYLPFKLPQFREISLQFRETWRSRAISGDSRKFRETWQV